MAKIAFIGLGHMGGGMAPNLAKAGHEVRAFDLVEEALTHARRAAAAQPRQSAAEAVKDADVVITMLPAGKHVARRLSRTTCSAPRPRPAHPDRLLDHRRRHRARRSSEARRRRAIDDGRRAGSGGIAAADGRHPDLHGRRHRRGVRARPAVPRADGQGGDPRRRARRGPGGQDLQQHDPRRDHGRDLRGVRAGAEARARPADLLRHLVQGVGPELVDDQLLPGPRRRPRNARRPRL